MYEKKQSEIMDITDISQHYMDAYSGSVSSKVPRRSEA